MNEPETWRRLHPRMLLVHPVNEVIQFFPAVIGAFVFGSASDGDHGFWFQVAAVVFPIALGLWRYATTTWRITGGQLELKRGLIGQRILTAPLDRIRTVELQSPVLHRLMGLAKVQVGTGSGEDRFELNSLAASDAQGLRASLLHRTTAASPEVTEPDHVFLRLDPRWARYAPLTSAGLVMTAVAIGALFQFGNHLTTFVDRSGMDVVRAVAGVLIAAGVIAFVVLIAVSAVASYLISNWGLTVSRDPAGRSFQIRRGLLTTTETNLDSERVFGVEVHQPVLLRAARAGQLDAIVTGGSSLEGSSATAVPPAPIDVVRGVGELMLHEAGPLSTDVIPHGRAALRRRWIRALSGALILSAVWSVLVWQRSLSPWLHAFVVVALVIAGLLAHDRFRQLGHARDGSYLVFQKGSLLGSRVALQTSGVIGWNFEETWFQRRVGVVTLTATTSAGSQAYGVYDMPSASAVALADEATPELLRQFLEPEGPLA